MQSNTKHPGYRLALWAVLLVLVLLQLPIAHSKHLVIPNSPVTEVGSHLEYLEDTHHSLRLETALQNPNWKSPLGSTPNFGLSESAFWFRINVTL